MSDRQQETPSGYQVGYGKPPKATQFGSRPQPRGREPRKIPDIDVAALLDGPARVERGGKIVRMHPHEIKMKSFGKQALRQKVQAIWNFLKECKKAGLLEPPTRRHGGNVVIIPKHMPDAVFSYLMNNHGLPPWEPKLRARAEADYARDSAIIAEMRTQHKDKLDE